MKVVRLTTALSVVAQWDFILEGLKVLSQRAKQPYDPEAVFKACCWLATNPQYGWVGVVFEGNKPEGFAIMEDATPIFVSRRTFTARSVWHKSGNLSASLALMTAFELWAFNNNIKEYSITTQRDSGAAIRCFQSEKFGFKKSFVTFTKEL